MALIHPGRYTVRTEGNFVVAARRIGASEADEVPVAPYPNPGGDV